MRFTVVDPRGRVSFIAPCATLEALVAACASETQPRTLEQLLKAAEPFVGDLGQRVLSGLAVFDEHNSPVNYRWIHAALDYVLPQEAPVFRVVDPRTEEVSLSPVRAGVTYPTRRVPEPYAALVTAQRAGNPCGCATGNVPACRAADLRLTVPNSGSGKRFPQCLYHQRVGQIPSPLGALP